MESTLSLNGGDLKVPLIYHEDDEEIGRPIEATTVPVSSSNKLGFGALVFLIYYNIGVPFGDEEVCTSCVVQHLRQRVRHCCTCELLSIGSC